MKPTHFVITASRTADGAAVYLGADDEWSSDLRGAEVGDEATVADRLGWARARQAEVCDPYRLGVRLRAGLPAALTARERIRAAGPRATLAALGYGEV